MLTVKPVSPVTIWAPEATSLSRTMSRWWAIPPLMCRSPPAMALAEAPVPADDPVGHGGVLGRMKPFDPVDDPGQLGGPADAGPVRDEHLAQVDDLGLPGHVVDDGGALGQDGRHQEVLGRSSRREVEPEVGAAEAVGGLGHDLPVFDAYDGAEPLQAEDVHVEST